MQAYLQEFPEGRYLAEAWACLEGQLGLDRAARVLVQQGLTAVGHDPGPADGLFGAGPGTRTRQAIRAWQAAKGMAETGYLTREQAETLMAVGQESVKAARAVQAQAEQAAQEEAARRQVQAADDAAYAKAQRLDTAAAYGEYLRAYPNGQHVQEARVRQAALQEAARQAQEAARRAQADDAAYAAAASQNTPEGYAEYLRAYPAGRHVAAARAAQQRLREQAEQQKLLAQVNAQMVRVQGGSFTMGCQGGFFSDCDDDEKPTHQVTVHSFELGKYEVTQGLWAAVMGGNPSDFQNCPQCPVEGVSWEDAQAFLRKLNAWGGRYRLPSEAEWEYAARGGSQNRGHQYAGSDSPNTVAWSRENSGERTHPVGQKQANEVGLYDLSGNVWEWVQDCWHDSYAGAPSNRQAWERGDCSRRVLRGGSWADVPRYLRSADRSWSSVDYRRNSIGFRIARSVD